MTPEREKAVRSGLRVMRGFGGMVMLGGVIVLAMIVSWYADPSVRAKILAKSGSSIILYSEVAVVPILLSGLGLLLLRKWVVIFLGLDLVINLSYGISTAGVANPSIAGLALGAIHAAMQSWFLILLLGCSVLYARRGLLK